MKRIQNFEAHRGNKVQEAKAQETKVHEAVIEVEDTYKVRTSVDVPKSFVNAYIKKVKDETGEDISQLFGDFDIAEELVKHVTDKYLDNDIISARALTGGEEEEEQEEDQADMEEEAQEETQETQEAQEETQEEEEDQEEKAEMEEETQEEGDDDFEDVQDLDEDGEEDEDLPI